MGHILGGCPGNHARQERLESTSGMVVQSHYPPPPSDDGSVPAVRKLRSDLVATKVVGGICKCYILDVSIVYEQDQALKIAKVAKEEKYAPIILLKDSCVKGLIFEVSRPKLLARS